MIKLLIAEDEHLERRAIRFYLDKFYNNKIEIAAEVANGEEAIFQALENNVDLVLMDIKMPKMSGLKAAETLKERSPNIEVIILTAHSEFDYARKSIQIGVSDYLVKPYLEDDFKDVIDNAVKKIQANKKADQKEKKLLKRLQRLTPILEKEVILDLVYNTESSRANFIKHKNLLGIESNKYMFLIFNTDDNKKIKQNFFQNLRNELKREIEGVIAYNGLSDMIFLLMDDNLEIKINSSSFKKLLAKTTSDFKKEFKRELNIIKSEIDNNLNNINNIYNQSRTNIYDQELNINSYPYQSEKKIFSKIVDKDYQQAVNEFKKIYNFLINEEKNNLINIKSYLRRFLVFLNRRLMEYYNKQQALIKMEQKEKEIELLNDPESLKLYFEKILKNLIEDLDNNAEEQKVEIIETVKEYIENNYKEDISLDEVADYISFSKYYLSKLFKEVEGINYKDYLIRVRMEAAKRLLKKGRKIKVVAREVGYSDRNYFSRAFKKYTGISPGKFQ